MNFNFSTNNTGNQSSTQPGGFSFGNTNTQSSSNPSTGFSFGTTNTPSSSTTGGFNLGGNSGTSNAFQGGSLVLPNDQVAPKYIKHRELNYLSQDLKSCLESVFSRVDKGSTNCNRQYIVFKESEKETAEAIKQEIQENLNKINTQSPQLLPLAKQENPDPSRYYPCLIKEPEELELYAKESQQKMDNLDRMTLALKGRIESCEYQLTQLLENIEKKREMNIEISSRILGVYKDVEVLAQRGYGDSYQDKQLQEKLNKIQKELNQPHKYSGKLNELAPQINKIAQHERQHQLLPRMIGETNMDIMRKALGSQLDGLLILSKTLKKDLDDVKYVKDKIEQKPKSSNQNMYIMQ